VTKTYKRDLDITRYKVQFLNHPHISLRTCHRGILRTTDDVTAEVRYALDAFPGAKEIFFDDDALTSDGFRTRELCSKFKPLQFTWSSKSPVTTDYETLKAMKEAGCRLLMVAYRPSDPIEMALQFTENCSKLGLVIHGKELVDAVERFYLEHFSCPRIVWRIVRKATNTFQRATVVLDRAKPVGQVSCRI
jgi:hypothetical protein